MKPPGSPSGFLHGGHPPLDAGAAGGEHRAMDAVSNMPPGERRNAGKGAGGPAPEGAAVPASLVDPHGRAITYLRVSVTDRCDFRCRYCMPEHQAFLPKRDILTLEELDRICSAFVRLGVRKIRLTGGEPLVRRNIMWLFRRLARHLADGALTELTLTTNGSQLARHAAGLAACGVRRVNVSLDTLDPERFRAITRRGDLQQVLAGIEAAARAGLHIKINTVAVRGFNEDELPRLITWAHDRGFDITLIETMPLGEIGGVRADQYLPLSEVRARLERRWTLKPLDFTTGGPSRYVRVKETGGRLGFITPLSAHFCDSCNRVRLTATGTLYLCLGQDDAADLRTPVRLSRDDGFLEQAIREAIGHKPRGHEFVISEEGTKGVLLRHMNVTGG
jgi:cyclic pyranopterin phosphate synthase